VLLQLPLLLDPGYLSFDELQWWDRASVAALADLPWVAWTDLHAFQFRPLTFNLWLLLAFLFAAHAWAMHAIFVALGSANALLMAAGLRRLHVAPAVAGAAAIAFVLSPYAAYTHGWTATLADLLVVLLALAGALVLLRDVTTASAQAPRALALAGFAALALLAKESAVVVPPLWLALALGRHPRRYAFAALAPALAVLALYLVARVPALWVVDAGNAGYAWSLANIPARLAEYAVFPWLPPLFEIGPSLDKSMLRLALAAACCAAIPLALASASRRHALAWIVAVLVALAPVLLLPRSFDHYAYLAAVAGIGVVAFAWRDCSRRARWVLLASAAIASGHGALIMLRMREIGVIEQRFHADLTSALAHAPQPLRVVAARAGDAWMLARWIDNVPRYRGVAIAGRVYRDHRPTDAAALVLVMQPDGSLQPEAAAR
jgi:hypothetical protein